MEPSQQQRDSCDTQRRKLVHVIYLPAPCAQAGEVKLGWSLTRAGYQIENLTAEPGCWQQLQSAVCFLTPGRAGRQASRQGGRKKTPPHRSNLPALVLLLGRGQERGGRRQYPMYLYGWVPISLVGEGRRRRKRRRRRGARPDPARPDRRSSLPQLRV